jgi:hypothetical protein
METQSYKKMYFSINGFFSMHLSFKEHKGLIPGIKETFEFLDENA